MKFYYNPLYVGATINKADITTTTGIITRTVYTTLALGAYFFNPRNSGAVRTSLPKSLKSDTVYYIGSAGLYLYKVYADEALTTQIMFTADDVLDVTQFEILPFGNLGYAQPFHSGASTLAEMVCCPPDRTRDDLFRVCDVYQSGTLVKTLRFQSSARGDRWDFWDRTVDFVVPLITFDFRASIGVDSTDFRKIVVTFTTDLGSAFPYKSLSMLAEDFTGTVTVFRPALLSTFYPAEYTLVFNTEVKVPPYARVCLPAAKFMAPEGNILIGDIEEVLTYDEPSNRYVGSVQTYYGIKGRLYLDVVFYPKPSSNIKYLGNRGEPLLISPGFISNVDITRTYTGDDTPFHSGIPLVFFEYGSIYFDTSYSFYGFGYTGIYSRLNFMSGINDFGTSLAIPRTPGLTYLAVSFATISKGTKTGYPHPSHSFPLWKDFRKTNDIKIASTSSDAYVKVDSGFRGTPPMPTPTPTPTPTPKGTYLQSIPSVPLITSADGGSGSPAIINFEPPLNNGGATITGYQYQVDGGTWYSGSSVSPILVEGLSVALHSICIRAVNSIGGGASACVDVTPTARISTGFVYVSQSGGGSYSGYGLSQFNKLMGVIESVGTAETMTFTVNANGVLTYYFETSDEEGAGGVGGEMSVDGISIATTAGTNNTSGTYDVTPGQSLVFTFTGASVSEFLFELHIIV